MADDPFELGDTSLDVSAPVNVESTPSPKPVPPKDPETGRFVSPSAASADATPPPAPSSSYLHSRARQLGFSEDFIASSSPTGLTEAVLHVQQARLELANQFANQRALDQPAPPPPVPRTDDEWDLGADLSGFDPTLTGAMKANFSRLAKEKKTLQDRLDALEKRDEQREVNTRAERIDAAFDALPEPMKKLFGDGTGLDLSRANAPEFKRRIALLQAAQLAPEDFASARTIHRKLKEMAGVLYPDLGKEPEKKPAAPDPYATNGAPRITPEQWANGGSAPPTHRRGAAELKGEEKAIAELTEKMRGQQQAGDQEILEGLLG